jgi:hypothetical protein
MNVEIGAEAALFPEKEYINGIAVTVNRSFLNFIMYKENSIFFLISVAVLSVETGGGRGGR